MSTLNVVLYQPEIPQNTGNIMRTCAATNTVLHLIEPLGFSLDEKYIKRSGANYIEHVKYIRYKSWEEFLSKNNIFNDNNKQMYFLSRYGIHSIYDVNCSDTTKEYFFVLGKESTGIPKEILQDHIDTCIRLPMTDKVRALNVSNCAAIIVYEALRQQGFADLEFFEPESMKGKDFLLK